MTFQRGDQVICRDAFGRDLERVVVSPPEGCYVDDRLTHDFAGVYITSASWFATDEEDEHTVFWPLEDVREAAAP